MELKLDNSKTYAIALEGGGAKGAYEVGVWQALEEAGIKYNAVSGTSVGALNGAMMVMRDLEGAVRAWKDIRLSDVIDLEGDQEGNLYKVLNGEVDLRDIQELIPQALDIIRNRGLDVAPLRAWVHEVADEKKIKESDVEFFVSTVSLTDKKGLEVKVNDLPEDEICDMLLASAYHPSFRLEKLGGKYYADGGFVDTLPLHVLVENGYKDIIAVRIPGHGIERRFRIPEDVNITLISTNSDLGGVLNFDAEQSRRDMLIGYLDAKRVLYGLYGEKYYIERTMSDREALRQLIDRADEGANLRRLCERELPRVARRLNVFGGDYYELFIAVLELEAETLGIENKRILKDTELLKLAEEAKAAR
ncbi:MAG: patatin-like phospholipase family protein [Candidatus Limivicinus sp.]|nr:patatin-like phospholipase family protein [Clostridiales bacterium]MCI7136896.1 patatin-like phospholipase family protein [Clostridiales bacterium]MDY6133488.1 patatin-like phospholipase family protein [Candidatus Limivicinus sp.]